MRSSDLKYVPLIGNQLKISEQKLKKEEKNLFHSPVCVQRWFSQTCHHTLPRFWWVYQQLEHIKFRQMYPLINLTQHTNVIQNMNCWKSHGKNSVIYLHPFQRETVTIFSWYLPDDHIVKMDQNCLDWFPKEQGLHPATWSVKTHLRCISISHCRSNLTFNTKRSIWFSFLQTKTHKEPQSPILSFTNVQYLCFVDN